METYLALFEKAIKKQAQVVGEKKALQHAKKAGLGVSKDGHIVSCVGDPQIVLLKLIKLFASSGNIEALAEVTALIDEIVQVESAEQEKETSEVSI